MTCNKSAVAAVSCTLVAAFDTLTAVCFVKRRVALGASSAIASAVVQILIMPYVDAHLIAGVAAISIPATLYIASPKKLKVQAKIGVVLILTAIPIGIGARASPSKRTCPNQQLVAWLYALSTATAVIMVCVSSFKSTLRRFLPVIDGIMGAATTLSAELLSIGTLEGILPLGTHGCSALAAAAISLQTNPAEYHVPISYAVWMAGILVTDTAVGHNIDLRYALFQCILSAAGVYLLHK